MNGFIQEQLNGITIVQSFLQEEVNTFLENQQSKQGGTQH